MDLNYFMKIQNAYSTNNRREKELVKTNYNMSKHFEDTYDTQDVLINNQPKKLMIIKDTDGNVFKKKIKSRHDDKFNLGDYVVWNNQYWIVTLVDPDEKTWNRGYMYLCTILLRWQDNNGDIIERWAYSEDYTKYSMGETGNSTITVGDYQYGITLPVDDYTKKLNRGKRFVIDYDGNYPPDTYRLAGKKGFLSDDRYFGRGGVVTFTLSYNFFNDNTDKFVKLENDTSAWICDYHSPTTPPEPETPDETGVSKAIKFTCSNVYIKPTGKEKTITANLINLDTNEIVPNITYEWEVESSIQKYVSFTTDKNVISISLSEECEEFGEKIKITCAGKNTDYKSYIELIVKEVF